MTLLDAYPMPVIAARVGSLGFLAAGYRTVEHLAADIATVRASTENFGVNLFVPERGPVESADAGGHRAVFDQHGRPGEEPLTDLVGGIRAITGLPLIAAGGLATPRQVAGVLQAGAQAAQVTTSPRQCAGGPPTTTTATISTGGPEPATVRRGRGRPATC